MKDKKEFKYEIGEKTFIQRPLVLGQIDQLIDCFEGLAMPETFSPMAIKQALGGKFYSALAIVLIPIGTGTTGGTPMPPIYEILKNKDIPALAEELKYSIDHETTLEVIEHFLGCNPIASILGRLTETIMKTGMVKIKSRTSAPQVPDNGSGSLLSSSSRETSPGETKSSGDTPPENAPLSGDIS